MNTLLSRGELIFTSTKLKLLTVALGEAAINNLSPKKTRSPAAEKGIAPKISGCVQPFGRRYKV